MGARLLQLVRGRFVFVVGKGGVGKTTTAGALALAAADSGRVTHLVSTDPAHSVGDLFEQDLHDGRAMPSRCHRLLRLEEFDAPARARAWIGVVGEPWAELIEGGTYLDEEDVRAFLDLSLPGMDEVMAALRLAELADDPEPDLVVVDTAPTGHMRRLVESARTLDGWSDALDAIAKKATVVASSLVGRQVRLRGQDVLQGLEGEVAAFRERVLEGADFVAVTTAGSVVHAETVRLLEWLRARGLHVAGLVRVDGTESPDAPADVRVLDVAGRDDLMGCDGLRRWGEPAERATEPARVDAPARGPFDPLSLRRDLLMFAGKGGVGKSTCAAAWALAAARREPVELVSVDPAGSLEDLFGMPVGPDGSAVAEDLVARQVDAEAQFAQFRDAYRARIAEVFERFGLAGSARLDRQVLESLLEMAPPGLDEIYAVDALLDVADGDALLVVDTAPTGHFLRLLEMPDLALAWTRAVLRILLRYRSALGLDDFAEQLLQFAKRLRGLVELLRDPERTGVVVVVAAGQLPRSESERLLELLLTEEVPVAGVIHNRVPREASRAGRPAPLSSLPVGLPEVAAPLMDEPPVGASALLSFVSAWEGAS